MRSAPGASALPEGDPSHSCLKDPLLAGALPIWLAISGLPTLAITPGPEALARLGLTLETIQQTVTTAIDGTEVGHWSCPYQTGHVAV